MDFSTREGRQSFYRTKEWKALRSYLLATQPWCVKCMADGYHVAATVCDHKIDIADAPNLRLEADNIQNLCTKHHNSKTAKSFNGKRIDKTKLQMLTLWKF